MAEAINKIGIIRKYPVFGRFFSSKVHVNNYATCYKILEIPETSNPEEIKQAFLKQAKKYHPDSGGDMANVQKFTEVEYAYRTLLAKLLENNANDNNNKESIQEEESKHKYPQHRQYLTKENVGPGTPFQREKEYGKMRAAEATENVMQHRIKKSIQADVSNKSLMMKPRVQQYKHDIKTKYGIDRLVEDLIQESMSKGEFNNLSCSGKPLPNRNDYNPFIDFTTHKLNEMLIENGFSPEWIQLQKDIRREVKCVQKNLVNDRKVLGPCPLNEYETKIWKLAIAKQEPLVVEINKLINKYNLIVPILQKQMFVINLATMAERILREGKHAEFSMTQAKGSTKYVYGSMGKDSQTSFLTYLGSIFSKK